MNRFPLLLALVAGCCLLRPFSLCADDDSPPGIALEKHYSADVNVVMKDGLSIDSKTYIDCDKMRSDFSAHGMQMEMIVRRDQKKVYQVMTAQKMVMELPFDPEKFKGSMGASFGPEGKFDVVGPDTVNGVACMKYKVTPDKSDQIYYIWLDAKSNAPVEMTDAAGSLTVKWSNFKPGPQDPALFEIPADYTVMAMPGGVGIPGGAPGGAPNGQGPGGP